MTTSDKIKMYYWRLPYQHTKKDFYKSIFFCQIIWKINLDPMIILLINKGNAGKPIGVLASWSLLKPQDGLWF